MDTGFDTIAGEAHPTARALAGELGRAIGLIGRLSDEAFTRKNAATGSVGEHVRHNLNFVGAVLSGARLGRIDYANRVRDVRVETDRGHAAGRFAGVIRELSRMRTGDAGKEVFVASELDASVVHRSSLGRELEFAHSHTVHHHAMIAENLRAMGIEMDAAFGVAPSTARFREEVQQTSLC